MSDHARPNRRHVLLTGAAAAAGLGISGGHSFGQTQLAPTPACNDGDAATLRQSEGPFFKPRTPERVSLLDPGISGPVIEISGFVLTRSCKPVARALLDFWQADAAGAYDNSGFRLRGHQYSDAEGRYQLRTIVPADYPGRTAHIHVKVQAPGGPVLTTQLYFPDRPHNASDFLFRRELLIRVAEAGEGLKGRFDFVLDLR